MTTRKLTTEQLEARDTLRELLPPGTTVWTNTEHVSRSGMSRSITARIFEAVGTGDAFPRDLTYWIARAGIGKSDERHGGIIVGGCGMDMGFHLIYSLSRALYPDGHMCTGHRRTERRRNGRVVLGCNSNDHANDYGRLQRQYDDEQTRSVGYSRVERDGDAYVSARQAWISDQLAKAYRRTRRHADGGYALSQRWM